MKKCPVHNEMFAICNLPMIYGTGASKYSYMLLEIVGTQRPCHFNGHSIGEMDNLKRSKDRCWSGILEFGSGNTNAVNTNMILTLWMREDPIFYS